MSNQVIVWSMLIPPWLTLFFMKRQEIKKWMPAALFVMVTTTIIHEVGITWGIWETHENAYPLGHMISFTYGALPIGAMWILKYTYGRFWLYAAVQLVGSAILVFIVQPWLHVRGIFVYVDQNNALAGIGAFSTTLVHLLLVYLYQMWQDEGLVLPKRNSSPAGLQPAAAKPVPDDNPDE
ncbi:hypothetical protein [Sporomusa acidovorans]|uniref:Uncharacterized protein n=1 Tax=Sporomusa acidovorans (strain ATCC 49682 / DSM 3132 / Mol) TaxID=1123286 RepID=A0ABZ3J872_SPOA4|nr:hypothetical protein [Sporomusa acidovorans]OZC15989.1 hypothetical protein SPACI_43550 [Sporomusa acidovorans DSM 3132]SDD90794.1 hypothetical protein SAMN04488499_1005142 [Sporomusa acidovorans]